MFLGLTRIMDLRYWKCLGWKSHFSRWEV